MLDEMFDDLSSWLLGLGITIMFLAGVLSFCIKFSYSDKEVRIDVDGNKYISSDLIEFDDDYYYKNADGDLIKIEFYDDDFKK